MRKDICFMVLRSLACLMLFCSTVWAQPFAYITQYATRDVTVIDTSTDTVVATITVGYTPWGITVNPDGTRVYVLNVSRRDVEVIDTSTNTVVATIALGGNEPQGVAVNSTGTRLYVTKSGPNEVVVIDTSNNTVVDRIPVDGSPSEGVAVNPAGTRVYAAQFIGSQLIVIDTSTNTVIDTIPVGFAPRGIAVNPAGTTVYVATVEGVYIIDTSTNTVVDTITAGDGPHAIAVNQDGTRVYVTNHVSFDVSVIDTSTNTVVATIAVGDNPRGLSLTPDGTKLYVVNHSTNNVSVIDTSTNTVVETVSVGPRPVSFGQFIIPAPAVVNNPPIAYDSTADIIENTGSIIPLVASDPDGDPLTYLQESSPSHAAAFLFNLPPGSATYFSGVTFPGTDSFTFKVNDGLDDSNVATVTIESAGYLVDPGNQTLTVTDLPAPVGVRIVTAPSGGPIPAQISICSLPFPPILVPAGADFTLTCGSATIEVLVGFITVPIDVSGTPVLLELDAGDYVTIDEQGTITNNGSESAEILINGIPVTIEPGHTIAIDSDFDGVPDAIDWCPNSNLNPTIVVDSCDSGVENVLSDDGCTISDLIAECASGASNHGEFVSCVAQLTNDLKSDGIITGKEKGKIQKCAAKADIP